MTRKHPNHEHNRRKAEQCDEAAVALEVQLNGTNDSRLRYELGLRIQQKRDAAAFYRGKGDKLQSET